jgi:diguanylate cyclase (GGDEF)-like protein
MKKNWNWLEDNDASTFVSPHCLRYESTLVELFDAVIKAAESAWDMSCSVLLINLIENTLHTASAPSLPASYSEKIDGTEIGADIGCCGSAAFYKKMVIVEDIQTSSNWHGFTELAASADLAACWSIPILNGEHNVLGTFACYFSSIQGPSSRQIAYMEEVSRTLAVAIEQHRMQRVITRLSNFDSLTGLHNRSAFRRDLQHKIDSQQSIALLFLDLDNFKEINDSLGHEAGDKMIQSIGERLATLSNQDVTFSRIGGDEFTVVYSSPQSREQLQAFSQQLINLVNQPADFYGHTIEVGASVGIAMYPEHGEGISQLMKHADIAMYQAKAAGRNCYCFFDDSMKKELLERIDMQKALRCAFEHEQFEVFFQPQVNTISGELVSVESLLRWHHPTKGLLIAEDFIESIESIGFSKIIDLWVLEKSCQTMVSLGLDISLSVNLSALYLSRECFPGRVAVILERTGFPADKLVFELIERTLIPNTSCAYPVMKLLQEKGIRFSIDDFGNGYSSLNYLKTLPVSEVKIDKSFVEGIDYDKVDRVICQNLCTMARELDLHIVAEGIENEAQKQVLQEMGCDTIQGFLISYPLSVDQLAAFSQSNCKAS